MAMERSVKPPTGRVVRRAGFVVAVLVVALAAGGCFVFDKERRENFKGPSWDVPLTIPLANLTVDGAELFEFEDGKTVHEEPVGGFKFTLPQPWPIEGEATLDAVRQSVELDDVWEDLLSHDGITVSPRAFLQLSLDTGDALEIELDLGATADSGATVQQNVTLVGGDKVEIDFSPLLESMPERIDIELKPTVKSKAGPDDPTVEFDAVFRVELFPLTIRLAPAGVEVAKPEPVAIDGDAKKSLEDIPLKNFSIVANVTDARDPDATDPAVPLQFAVEFYSAPPAMDAAPVRYVVSLAGGQPDADAWAKIRDKLSGPDPHVGMKVLAESADKKLVIDSDASYRVEAYMVIEMNVNKR